MPSLTTFFWVFIAAGLGAKAAVMSGAFHPVLGVLLGGATGLAALRYTQGQPK